MNVMGGVVAVHKASADGVPALGIAGRQRAAQQSCKHLVDLALGDQAGPVVGEAIEYEMVLPVTHYDAWRIS